MYACILGSSVIQRGFGGRVSKKYASQRGGSGEFEHGLLPFAPALPPLNNDPSLTTELHLG